VAYVNGSGQPTSASGFTYDGTTFSSTSGITGSKIVNTGNVNLYNSTSSAITSYQQLSSSYSATAITSGISGAAAYLAFSTYGNWTNGNASEVMRLDQSGNMGIGISSPSQRLDVVTATSAGLRVATSTATASTASLFLSVANNFSGASQAYVQCIGSGGSGVSQLAFGTAGAAGDTTATERARIDSSGNFLLATTTAPSSSGMSLGTTGTVRQLLGGMTNTSWRLREGINVDYAVLTTNITDGGTQDNSGKSSWKMGMGYGNVIDNWSVYRSPAGSNTFTSLMTLNASGCLLVGTTTAQGTVGSFYSSGNTLWATGTNSNNHPFVVQNTNGGSVNLVAFQTGSGNGSTVGSITYNGSITLYNTTSDQRLKENIVDAPEFGNVIDAIQVRSYDWKASGNHQRAGFIAQELVTVAPEAVHQPTDAEEMMAVDYSKLVPMLVKEIQSLRQRLSAANL
jgi:hypothetical protein